MAQDGQVPGVLGGLGAAGRRSRGERAASASLTSDSRPGSSWTGSPAREDTCAWRSPWPDGAGSGSSSCTLPRPLLQPEQQLHHDQRGEPAKVDLAGDRDRLGRPFHLRSSSAGPARRAAATGAACTAQWVSCRWWRTRRGPQARQYRALAAAQHRQQAHPAWPGGLAGPRIEPAAVPPDEPVPGGRRQHPGHRVPPGLSQEPRIQQGRPACRRLARAAAPLTQHRRQAGPRRAVRRGSRTRRRRRSRRSPGHPGQLTRAGHRVDRGPQPGRVRMRINLRRSETEA